MIAAAAAAAAAIIMFWRVITEKFVVFSSPIFLQNLVRIFKKITGSEYD